MILVAPKSITKTLQKMRGGAEIHFGDLVNVCRFYFGEPTIHGSHHIFNTGIKGARINIQPDKGRAKPYQVRQVLAVIDQLP